VALTFNNSASLFLAHFSPFFFVDVGGISVGRARQSDIAQSDIAQNGAMPSLKM
jgi:hypothetical protein